jgi:hypothetical protein
MQIRITRKPKLPIPTRPIDNSFLQAGLIRILSDVIVQIRAKTSMGIDREGKNFTPYSPSYAEYKRTKTGNSKVTLVDTGKMLKAMQTTIIEQVNKTIGRIFFNPIEVGKAAKNQERRKFFGIAKAEEKNLNDKIKEIVKFSRR